MTEPSLIAAKLFICTVIQSDCSVGLFGWLGADLANVTEQKKSPGINVL